MTSSLMDHGLEALVNDVRTGAVTAAAVVEATLDRIHTTEPILHAYAEVFAAEARSAAEDLDRRRESGESLGSLAGVTIAVKEIFDVIGHATRAGSRAYDDAIATADSAIVTRARHADAIVIGHAVSHELGYGANTPATRNAIDPSKFPGSSSSGSAVAVAAGSAAVAIGGDSGGSVRVPAALNGIVGLKPTRDVLNTAGSVPMSPVLDTTGLMARSVADLTLLWRVLSGRKGSAEDMPDRVRLGRVKYDTEIDPAIAAVLSEGISRIDATAVTVSTVRLPHPGIFRAVGTALVVSDTARTHEVALRERAALIDARTRNLLAAGWGMRSTTRLLADRLRAIATTELESLFAAGQGVDVVALPGMPFVPGPPEDFAGHVTPELVALTHDHQMLANVTGHPAITFPFGRLADGFPVSLQLVGRPNSEELLLALAGRLEPAVTRSHEITIEGHNGEEHIPR